MKFERILLALDDQRCPFEVFPWLRSMAGHPGVTLTLLHVVRLGVQISDNRVYEELGRAAAAPLERFARAYLAEWTHILVRIRVGRPAEEILAEARTEQVDLIILPAVRSALCKRSFRPNPSLAMQKIIRSAPCPVLVTSPP